MVAAALHAGWPKAASADAGGLRASLEAGLLAAAEAMISKPVRDFVSDVRRLTESRIAKALSSLGTGADIDLLWPGKMLRTRLASRLSGVDWPDSRRQALQRLCVATEMVHTASLCHDDVVDSAVMRRSRPALWRAASPSGAVLIGDVLLCEAMALVMGTEGGRYLGGFIRNVRQVVEAEAEQGLVLCGSRADEATCLRLARGKTGPLFGFVARACGGRDESLCEALEASGFDVGAAYQLADDLLDVFGSEEVAGKTLGTDLKRGKFTLPHASDDGCRITRDHVGRLCRSSLERLESYPEARGGLRRFLADDLGPVLRRHVDVSVELAV